MITATKRMPDPFLLHSGRTAASNRLDRLLTAPRPGLALAGARRGLCEFLAFGVKEARSCLFAGLFFLAVFAVPRGGWMGIQQNPQCAVGRQLLDHTLQL